MKARVPEASHSHELVALRQKITELVAKNALPMVQHAIDAVCEDGQYQAMKFLFEMVGLYPTAVQNDGDGQESLSRILLAQLGLLEEQGTGERDKTK